MAEFSCQGCRGPRALGPLLRLCGPGSDSWPTTVSHKTRNQQGDTGTRWVSHQPRLVAALWFHKKRKVRVHGGLRGDEAASSPATWPHITCLCVCVYVCVCRHNSSRTSVGEDENVQFTDPAVEMRSCLPATCACLRLNMNILVPFCPPECDYTRLPDVGK